MNAREETKLAFEDWYLQRTGSGIRYKLGLQRPGPKMWDPSRDDLLKWWRIDQVEAAISHLSCGKALLSGIYTMILFAWCEGTLGHLEARHDWVEEDMAREVDTIRRGVSARIKRGAGRPAKEVETV